MSAYSALTRKNHGKTHVPTATKKLYAKVDKIMEGLSPDTKEIAQYRDIFHMLNNNGNRLLDNEEDVVRDYLRDKYEIY
jgi:hypothetical protein